MNSFYIQKERLVDLSLSLSLYLPFESARREEVVRASKKSGNGAKSSGVCLEACNDEIPRGNVEPNEVAAIEFTS
jgi:hypothetical protein